MKEDFVPYNIAVKLKDKGYPQNGNHYYNEKGRIDIPAYNLSDEDMSDTVAPQIHEVLKWLRYGKKIHMIIDISEKGWFFNLRCLKTGYIMGCTVFGFSDTYEQAVLAGVNYCLENLI